MGRGWSGWERGNIQIGSGKREWCREKEKYIYIERRGRVKGCRRDDKGRGKGREGKKRMRKRKKGKEWGKIRIMLERRKIRRKTNNA